MATVQLPPQTEPLIDESNFPTLPWISFFDGLSTGDTGTAWVPNFVGLTENGVATKTGIYYKITSKLAYFRILITPTIDTSATNGVTYCDNFPLTITSASAALSCTSFSAAISGITPADKRIYTSTWTALTTPVTIIGLMEVN